MKIEKLNFVSLPSKEKAIVCLTDLTNSLFEMEVVYPEIKQWFNTKVLPGLLNNERQIVVAYDGIQLAGFALLKNCEYEKKICTLKVLPDYVNAGSLGLKLFNKSFEILETELPLLSVSEQKLNNFEKIFKFYNFKHYETYADLYRKNIKELSFNGYLNENQRKTFELQTLNSTTNNLNCY